MNAILTCTSCAAQRAPQDMETHIVIGGQTNAYCKACDRVHPHLIGIPAQKPIELEFARRKP